MGGFILLFLIVIIMVFVVPAVALAKASRALRAIEELKQRLLMLEARLHRGGVPTERPEIVAQPKPPAPIIPPVFCATASARYGDSTADTRDETDHAD